MAILKRPPIAAEPPPAPTVPRLASTQAPTPPPPPIGHNQLSGRDALRSKTADLRDAGQEWAATDIIDKETADGASAFIRQIKAHAKALDVARAEEKAPHDKAGKDVQGFFVPLIDSCDRVVSAITRRVTAWQIAERDRIARQLREAQAEAERAAKLAEALEIKAAETGDFALMDHAADARAALAKADADASRAAATRVRTGETVTVNGVKKAMTLRTFETIICSDVLKAAAFFVENSVPMLDVCAALEKTARAYRQKHPGVAIPGIAIETEERAI